MYGIISYGYQNQFLCLLCIISACHLSCRAFSTTVLLMCSVKLALTATFLEFALYLLFKLIRCDMGLFIWDSFPPGVHFLISILYRILKKAMFDYNGLIQEKHSYDMGGFYMSLCYVWVQVYPYIALTIYYECIQLLHD